VAAARLGDVMSKIDLDISNLPDTTVSVREVFGIDTDLRVPA
jgi:cobaltochelatase CobS